MGWNAKLLLRRCREFLCLRQLLQCFVHFGIAKMEAPTRFFYITYTLEKRFHRSNKTYIILDQKLIVKVKTLTQIFHNIKKLFCRKFVQKYESIWPLKVLQGHFAMMLFKILSKRTLVRNHFCTKSFENV